MTMLLASVKNLSEVRKILTTNFDIIDLKNPSDGVWVHGICKKQVKQLN